MEKPDITIETLENLSIIYIRFRGSYTDFRKNSKTMFEKLFKYATKHNLIVPNKTKVMTLYHDNPFITTEKNLRTSVAMTIPDHTEIIEEDEISTTKISGKFGVGHFELSLKEYGEAWQYMYQEWLFKGKATPRDAVPFELYVTEPPKNFKGKSFTDIYIPIE